MVMALGLAQRATFEIIRLIPEICVCLAEIHGTCLKGDSVSVIAVAKCSVPSFAHSVESTFVCSRMSVDAHLCRDWLFSASMLKLLVEIRSREASMPAPLLGSL